MEEEAIIEEVEASSQKKMKRVDQWRGNCRQERRRGSGMGVVSLVWRVGVFGRRVWARECEALVSGRSMSLV